jgi:actin-related protein
VGAVAGVHDGYVLTKSISRSPVGGKVLNTCLQKALQARGIQVKPRQTFKRVEKKPGEFVVSLDSLCIPAGSLCRTLL